MRINRQRAVFWLCSLLAVSTLDSPPVAAEAERPPDTAVERIDEEHAVILAQVDGTANEPPEDRLKLSAAGAGRKVHLHWSGEIESNIVAIEVFRGEGVDGSLERLAEITDLDTTAYTDDNVQLNTDYRYALWLRDREQNRSAACEPLTVDSGPYVRRINCGGEVFVGADGIPWEADEGRVAGTGRFTSRKVLAGVYPEVRTLYQSERWSYRRLGYHFDLLPGRYAVVLCFAETNPNYMGEGKRTFDIFVGGDKVHEAFDVFSQAGANKPLHLTIHVNVSKSPLVVELRKNKTGPALKGIAIEGLLLSE